MPVQTSTIDFPFVGGLNTHDDVKLIEAPQLADIVNGVFRKGGTLTKRYGFDLVTGPGDGAEAVVSYRDQKQLLAQADDKLYSYLEATNAWADRGNFASAVAMSQPIQRSYGDHLFADSCVFGSANEFALVAWENLEDGASYVEYKILERATGNVYTATTRIGAGRAPRCSYSSATGLSVWFLNGSTGDVSRHRLDPDNPAAAGTTVFMASNGSSGRVLDVAVDSSGLLAAWEDSTTSTIFVGKLTTTGGFTSTTNTSMAGDACVGVSLGTTAAAVVSGDSDLFVRAVSINRSTNASSAVQTSDIFADPILSVHAEVNTASSGSCTVRTSTRNASTGHRRLWQAALTVDATPTATLTATPSRTRHHVNLASKTVNMTLGGSTVACGVFLQGVLDDPTQYTHYFGRLGSSDTIRARFNVGVAGDTTLPGPLSNLTILDTIAESAALVQTLTRSDDTSQVFTVSGTDLVTFTPPSVYPAAEVGNSMYFGGGTVSHYDGGPLVEHGFFANPYILSATAGGVGGSLGTGTYFYRAVYEWTNDNGEVMRSAPSRPESVSVTAGQEVTLTVSTLPITAKLSSRQSVRILIYRGLVDSAVTFYRVSGVTSTTGDNALVLNDTSQSTLSFVDALSDANASLRETIYTDGLVVENDCPPGFTAIAAAKSRLWGIAQDDTRALWYTKEVTPLVAPEFSAAFVLRNDDDLGGFTAIAGMDDKLIAFKERGIYYVSGDGPNAQGVGIFSPITQIAADVGCTERASVISTTQGVFFKSAKGIYLLTRGLEIRYIGAAVHSYNAEVVTGACIRSDNNEVLFTTAASRALVYNYRFDAWSTFDNHESPAACIFDGKLVTINDDGDIRLENSTYADNGSAVSLEFTTAWFKLAGIQGFQRVYKLFLLGNWIENNEHSLTLDIAYNYDSFFSESVVIDTTTALNADGYGDGGYGQGGYGGYDSDQTYQFRFDLPRTRCTSVQFRLRDSSVTPQENYEINAISLEVGVLPGSGKLRDKKHAE